MSDSLSAKTARQSLPNPFRTYSNYIFPRTMKDVLDWASYLWERNPAYKNAIQKVVSYFVSDITVTQDVRDNAVDTASVENFKKMLVDDYGALQLVLQFGEELAAMGNVFLSAERVFTRELACPTPGCGWQMRLHKLRKGHEYDWDGTKFHGKCPACGKEVTYRIQDNKSQLTDGRLIRFVFRSAEDMHIQYNRLTGSFRYLYKVPSDVLEAIRRGDPVYLEDSPKVFLDAAAQNSPYIEFPEDMFYAARTHTLSNLDRLYKGWGLPLFMSAFDNIVRLQHLDKFNEAVVLDYLVPKRIVSPAPHNLQAGLDPNRMPLSGSAWCGMMSAALRGSISNPTQWILSPVPVQQQQIGGDKSVLPTEHLEYEKAQMQEDIGLPMELRQTSFQTVAPSMGLRMFERRWVHFAKSMGGMVKWLGRVLSDAHRLEDMRCELDMTSFVENDVNRQVALMLMQGGVLAKTQVLKSMGISYEDDLRQQIKEQSLRDELYAEQQDQMQGAQAIQSVLPPSFAIGVNQAQAAIDAANGAQQQAAMGGAPGPMPPGAPAMPAAPTGAGGQGQAASIEQMYQQAQEIAQQLYAAPPQVRRSELVNMKSTNPQLHALVKQFLTDMAQDVASQAVAQSRSAQ